MKAPRDRIEPEDAGGFRTARLRAEPLTLGHADVLFPILARDADLYRYIPQDPPKSLEAVRARISKVTAGHSADGSETWLNWVLFRQVDDVLVGTLEATVREAEHCALVAYFVFADHRRQGIAAEALGALTEVLFVRFPSLLEVKAYIDAENTPSIGLARKVGMQQVEIVPDADHFDGKSRTEYVFCMTRTEYDNRPRE